MKNQEKLWDLEYSKHNVKWKKERVNFPRVFKNKSVLEVGVGNGKNIPFILSQKPSTFVAMDISDKAIKLCKDKYSKDKIEFLKEDFLNSNFKSKSFDIILFYFVLNNMKEKDRDKAVSLAKKLLRKGGLVLFEDFAEGDVRQSNSKKIIESNTIERKDGIICHFFTKKEVRDLFSDFKKANISERSSKISKKDNSSLRKTITAEIAN